MMPEHVVIINDVSVIRGGATSVALRSAQFLRERGVRVTVITGEEAHAKDVTGDDVVEVTSVGSSHILVGSRWVAAVRGLYNKTAESFLSTWIASHDTPRTVYHLHGWSKVLSPSVFRALRPVRSRLVIHAHDFFLVCPNGGYYDFRRDRPCKLQPLSTACITCNCDRRNYAHKLWRVARLILRRLLCAHKRHADVLVVHDAMLPLLELGGLERKTLRVMRNPVSPWRGERIPAEKNRLLLYVGRLDEDKGADIAAFAARRAGVPLRMIGTGPLSVMLERNFPEIEFKGWRTTREIADLCLDARALILPTRSRETFGLVALEALMSGLPVIISSNAMMAPELVAGGFGLACDPHDPGALADLIGLVAADDELISAMSRNAYAGARRLAPSVSEWTDELLAVYGALLRRNAAAARPI